MATVLGKILFPEHYHLSEVPYNSAILSGCHETSHRPHRLHRPPK